MLGVCSLVVLGVLGVIFPQKRGFNLQTSKQPPNAWRLKNVDLQLFFDDFDPNLQTSNRIMSQK